MAAIPPVRVPVQVEIVRPKREWSDTVSPFFAGIVSILLAAWILMLALGTLTEWPLGYWESVLATIGLRVIQRPDSYLVWTKERRK